MLMKERDFCVEIEIGDVEKCLEKLKSLEKGSMAPSNHFINKYFTIKLTQPKTHFADFCRHFASCFTEPDNFVEFPFNDICFFKLMFLIRYKSLHKM